MKSRENKRDECEEMASREQRVSPGRIVSGSQKRIKVFGFERNSRYSRYRPQTRRRDHPREGAPDGRAAGIAKQGAGLALRERIFSHCTDLPLPASVPLPP